MYSDYVLPELSSRTDSVTTFSSVSVEDYSKYAGVAMVVAMVYLLVIERNVALFAVLFLMLAIFYNPTKFAMNGKLYQDSEVII